MQKVAVFFDCVGCEYMEFNIKEESQVDEIMREWNSDPVYNLIFDGLKEVTDQ